MATWSFPFPVQGISNGYAYLCLLAFGSLLALFHLGRFTSTFSPAKTIQSHNLTSDPTTVSSHNSILWLLTCETRTHGNKDLRVWFDGALRFREANHPVKDRIQIQNICEGVPWDGFLTKLNKVEAFLMNLTNATDNEMDINLVMFLDSDAYFNSYAVTLDELLQRYHQVRNGKDILVSAEPACWVGHHCSEQELKFFYPNATTRSLCNQFLNSGQFMGPPKALLEMFLAVRTLDTDDDQKMLSHYHMQEPHKIQMDTSASVFRSAIFGALSTEGWQANGTWREGIWQGITLRRTCGTDAIGSCPMAVERPFPRVETMVEGKPVIRMDPVVGCEPTQHKPFSIHFNSKAFKPDLHELYDQVRPLYHPMTADAQLILENSSPDSEATEAPEAFSGRRKRRRKQNQKTK